MPHFVLVLGDNETYGDLHNSKIVAVSGNHYPPADLDRLVESVAATGRNLPGVTYIGRFPNVDEGGLEELGQVIRMFLPDAVFDVEDDGQLIIYTNRWATPGGELYDSPYRDCDRCGRSTPASDYPDWPDGVCYECRVANDEIDPGIDPGIDPDVDDYWEYE